MCNEFRRSVKLDIYPFKLHIIVSDDIDTTSSRFIPETANKAAGGIFMYNREYPLDLYIIFSDDYNINHITHESLHATIHILRYIDLPLTEESEEAYTYLLGFISSEVDKTFEKYYSKYGSKAED